MLLTDRFVYIHEPKTGGTFVTHVLSELHGGLTGVRPSRRVHEGLRLRLPTASFWFERRRGAVPSEDSGGTKYGRLCRWNDHGGCCEIPGPYRSQQIVATIRSPFQKYVSGYLFGWWKRPEYLSLYRRRIPDFHRRYPDFPELTFPEYMELIHASWTVHTGGGLYSGEGVGFQTERFVRFYFHLPWLLRGTRRDVASVVRKVDGAYVRDRRYEADLFDVRFLRTDRLNQDLHEFLLETGYDASDVEFVAALGHVVPVGGAEIGFAERASSHDWMSFYTPALRDAVRVKDDLLFALFPEFDVPFQQSA